MTGLERLAGGRWPARETTETPTPEQTEPAPRPTREPKPRFRRPKRDPEASKAAMERLMGGPWEA